MLKDLEREFQTLLQDKGWKLEIEESMLINGITYIRFSLCPTKTGLKVEKTVTITDDSYSEDYIRRTLSNKIISYFALRKN